MKGFIVLVMVLCCTFGVLLAQDQMERSPIQGAEYSFQNLIEAPWDLQFGHNLEIITGALGNAGAEFDGTSLYSTRWASNLLHEVTVGGTLVREFSVTGVTGLRDLAYDGAFYYGGAAATTIYQMDFSTTPGTLISTISSPVPVRWIAYDEAADAFWVGNWDTPPTLVSRAGTTLATFTSGLSSQYGAAYDKYSSGGPYLWIFDQGAGAGMPQYIHQFDIASGTATGFAHDVLLELGPNPAAIAGGLWIAEGVAPGIASIGGVLQGTPDVHFAYELATAGDPFDPNPPTNVAAYSDYLTPTSMLLTWDDPTTLVNGDPITPFTIEIERDGAPLTSVASGTETYTDMGLNDGQLYTYDVYAKLISNDSTSAPITVAWHAGGHPVPAPPENLEATGTPFDAVLTWDDPTTQADGTPLDDLDHINIYRDGVLVGNVAPGVETYTDTPPVAGFYTYTVTAVDDEVPPNESDPSNEAGTFVGASPDFLVWVHPDVVPGTGSAASGDSLFEALVANGQSVYLTNNLFEFGADLSIYNGVFVVLGIYSNNGILLANSAEALALETYVMNGGSLYLEGGDCFYYDPQFAGGHDINPWFDCVPVADGSGDVFALTGLNEMSAFSFAYAGENNWMDQLSSGGLSSEIWQENTTMNIHGLFYDGWGGAAIGVVPSFGGMVSTSSMVSSGKRTYEGANQKPQAGSYKPRPERTTEERFLKKGAYKPELAARIDRSKPLYKITPNGIEFLANNQVDLMAAYIDLMNPAPELMYYKFNEVGSQTTQNYAAAGTPVPATANVLGLTMGGTGFEGAALIGNGGSSGTNYVDTGWPTSLSGSWTISFWVDLMPTTTTLYYYFGDNTAGSFRCFTGGVAGADNLILRGTGMTDVLITGVAPGPSEVAFVYDDAMQEIRGYLNGALQVTVSQAAPLTFTGTAPFKVGGYSTSAGIPANMLLDEWKLYSRAVDVEPNTHDYAVTEFVDLPQFWYAGVSYDVKALVINDGANAQTDVPIRLLIDGVQVGSDVLVSLNSGDSAVVSFPWTPADTGMTNVRVQSFLPGDQDPSNDYVATDVQVDPDYPLMVVYPSALSDSLEPPDTSLHTMTIRNDGAGALDFTITIEGVEPANLKVDLIAEGKARSAPIKARGREIPVEEYLLRTNMANGMRIVPNAHPEDMGAPYDQIAPSRPGNGLKKISNVALDGPDGEEIFGSNAFIFGPAGARGRGNIFSCTSSTTLIEHRLYMNPSTPANMYFVVYEGLSDVGMYNLISAANLNPSATGEGWYSSGPISVPMEAGKFYLIETQWDVNSNYWNNQNITPFPIPASFGQLIGCSGWNWVSTYAVPPAGTQNVLAAAIGQPVAYYQTIVTGAGASWLTVDPEQGTVAPGDSLIVDVTFDAGGLLGGDYYANIIVDGNDPFNLSDTSSAHLFVIGAAFGNLHPDPTDFGQVFLTDTKDMTMWVENEGNGVMNVSGIVSSAPEFTVTPTTFDVPPFDSVEITVTFAPTDTGAVNATLTVSSNASNDPFGATVMGVGVTPPQADITPNFSNPIGVQVDDSSDVTISILNAAGAGAASLLWNAAISDDPLTPKQSAPFVKATVAEHIEASPNMTPMPAAWIEAPFDLQFSYNLEVITGALGNAGTEFDGTSFYTTRWASNLLHEITTAGTLVREFSVTGVTGLRDLAYDGAFFYGGAAATTIYQMDFSTTPGTLIGTITSPVPVRYIAYDEGADAFWVGNWDTPPTLVSRSGTNLGSITSGVTSQYGAAYDSYTDGGPYLWIYDQGLGAGNPQFIHQIDIAAGVPTGVMFDVKSVVGGADPNAIAGGLWISEGIEPGLATLGGLQQGTPDMLFGLELAQATPPWIQLVGLTSGSLDPGDQYDLMVRLYGVGESPDTAWVNITTNDPGVPVANIMVIREIITGIGDLEEMPKTFAISQNYPNPFNPTTTFKYQLPRQSDVKLVIYNVLGQKVRTLINGQVEAGYHNAVWDGRNDKGVQAASGIYIYRFEAGDYVKTMKMMLLK